MLHPECEKWRERSERVLAGGPGTFSKAPSRYPQGFAPFALTAGEGCYVTGTNGQAYLDTVAALGAVVLGYSDPTVTLAIMEQAERGCSFSMVHPLEIEVAEILCAMLPCADMVRFCRNGTDATHMAVRLARAITGKRHVLFAGYHGGGGDSYGITTDKHAGILPGMAFYNHQRTWDTWGDAAGAWDWDDLACIMTEVPALRWDISPEVYRVTLAGMQEEARAHGALFVLDEVVTFPRAGLSCQEHYGIVPDLACVSKGIANGMPLAALVGRREYMERLNDGDIFASYTFAGETTALAACKATLAEIRKPHHLECWHNYGRQYGNALQDLTHDIGATVYGHPWRLVVRWKAMPGATANELRTLWLQEHAKAGILHGIGAIFPMACWQETDLDKLTDVAINVSFRMRTAIEKGTVQQLIECPIIGDVLSVRP